jgi:hypothetical protein
MPGAKELKAHLKANRWKRKSGRATLSLPVDILLITNPGIMRWKTHAALLVPYLHGPLNQT